MSQEMLADNPSRRGVGRAARRFARPYAVGLCVAVVLGVIASLAITLRPVIIGRITDALLGSDASTVVILGGTGILLAVVQTVLAAVSRARLARAGELLVRDVRDSVAHRLATASLSFVQRHRAGELLQRSTAEVAELSAFVRESLTNLLVTGSTVVLFVVVLGLQSWQLLLVLVLVFLPPSLFVLHRFRSRAVAAFGAEAQAEAAVAATIAEEIRVRSLIRTAPASTRARMAAVLGRDNDRAVAAQMKTVVLGRWINGMALIEGAALIALLVAGTALVAAEAVTVGVVVTFVLASVTLFSQFSDLVSLLGAVEETLTSAARVNELIERSAEPPSGARSGPPSRERLTPSADAPVPDPHAGLEVDGVWFGYGGAAVLRDVSLRLAPGTRCGLAGRSGAGKSTLATLIAGLRRPDRGTIRCAGIDLAGVRPDGRAALVAFVPQDVVLGSGTLADELRLVAPDADDETLRAAVRSLDLERWLDALPEGLATPVGGGSLLTTGERQLVGLVRVALRQSPVIVLDEATSDVDPASAALVERAIDDLAGSRTVIVVAHREATLARLDRVFEVADGRIIERMR